MSTFEQNIPMPEQADRMLWQDKAKNPVEIELHAKGYDFSLNSEPLINRQEAIEKYGVNGDVMAVIRLPDANGDTHDGKEVAIIDHGVDFATQEGAVQLDGKALGRIKSRYALYGLNYKPESHIFPYAPIGEGKTVIGRLSESEQADVNKDVSYMVGLGEGEEGNSGISRRHFTVEIGKDVRVFDHSSNGTRVNVYDKERGGQADSQDVLITESQPVARLESNDVGVNNQETGKDEYLLKLFAPRLVTSEKSYKKSDPEREQERYRRLLMGEPEQEKPKETLEEKMNRESEEAKYVPDPTESQKRESWSRMHRAASYDGNIQAILGKYISDDQMRDSNLTSDIIRKNADLRYELGNYFLQNKLVNLAKIPHKLPYRVLVNGQKNPNHVGYGHVYGIRSREYAAMLAISMLDGTYEDPGSGDPIERGSTGQVELGQHRAAAKLLLEDDWR